MIVNLWIAGQVLGVGVAALAAIDLFRHAFLGGGDESVLSGLVALVLGTAVWFFCGGRSAWDWL